MEVYRALVHIKVRTVQSHSHGVLYMRKVINSFLLVESIQNPLVHLSVKGALCVYLRAVPQGEVSVVAHQRETEQNHELDREGLGFVALHSLSRLWGVPLDDCPVVLRTVNVKVGHFVQQHTADSAEGCPGKR